MFVDSSLKRKFLSLVLFSIGSIFFSQQALAQVSVIAFQATEDCANSEAINTFVSALQTQMTDALIIIEVGEEIPADTNVVWTEVDEECVVSVTSSAGQTTLPLEQNASDEAIYDVTVRVAWLANLGTNNVFAQTSSNQTNEEVENEEVANEEVNEETTNEEVENEETTNEENSAEITNEEVENEETTNEEVENEETTNEEVENEETTNEEVENEETTNEENSAEMPIFDYGISLLPGIEFPRGSGFGAIRRFSFGLANGTSGITGLDFGLILNITNGDVEGVQFSPGFNLVHGNLIGVQISSVFNLTNSFTGIQMAQFNMSTDPSIGVQVGSVNLAGDLDGTQGGIVNVAQDMDGAQFGIVNVGRDVDLQVSLVNSARDTHSQFSLVNSARDTSFQLGLFNFARSSDVSIGLLSIVTSEPLNFYAAINERQVNSFGLRHGSKYLQTILEVGVPSTGESLRYGVGFGGHIPLSEKVWLELDTLFSLFGDELSDKESNTSMLGEFRTTFGYQLTPRFCAFLGVNNYILWGNNPEDAELVSIDITPEELDPQSFLWIWPGARAGIRF